METSKQIISLAVSVILTEAETIKNLAPEINHHFVDAIESVFHSKGRLIVTGIGKSAIIAQKIVATLNSTGTPAVFMHAADAIHGDLGIVLEDDIVLCLSKSGNTPEIKVLVPILRKRGNKLIAMVSNQESYLAKNADIVLFARAEQEACPNNLAPTSSTTAQLVLGDALAVCLLKLRGFSPDDFAKVHPGGALGKKLYMRVSDLVHASSPPKVNLDSNLKDIILAISSGRLGAAVVVNADGTVAGIITDGDLRRMLEKGFPTDSVTAEKIMSLHPKTIQPDDMAINAFVVMEKNKITQLVVTDGEQYTGIVHLHDILREGIV
ncbi:MAG: D-arabinose 5-phosphate isomerase [Bacteroidetes bacterium HGW-Bacteroidetes-21]|nr:MAG: D-arabinose 5-phosphate isomerase [Bacteroidetes bacterium HGW-Bacteroidetes-21]